MDIESSDDTFTIDHDTDTSRFTLSHEGKVIGVADYIDREAGPDETSESPVRTFTHTEVSPAFGGRGLAGHLVKFALETTAEAGFKFRTTCSYVMNYVQKHPEFEDSRA